MALPVLKRSQRGDAVFLWQNFLVGQGLLDQADGIFGLKTEEATKAYQRAHSLKEDGEVGNQTYGTALLEGLAAVEFELDFPPKPPFPPLVDTAARQAVFGRFDFELDSQPGNREHIRILGSWQQDHIQMVSLLDLEHPIIRANSKMPFHKEAGAQLQGLWQAWKAKDLVRLILTFDGSFVPRLIRGAPLVNNPSKLSNHAFGSAFDINAAFNPLGHLPASISQKGSVRLLVPIANDYGFYWGGHFSGRKDGMHFEVAKILSSAELATLTNKYNL